AQQPGGLLLAGEAGSGKSAVLGQAARLLERPAAASRQPLKSRFVGLPADTSVGLAGYLTATLGGAAFAEAVPAEIPDDLFASWLVEIAERCSTLSVGFVVVDDLSRRMAVARDGETVRAELDMLKDLTETFARAGVLVAIAVDAGELEGGSPTLRALGGCCETLRLSRANLADAISSLCARSARHDEGVGRIFEDLAAGLPGLAGEREMFLRLYPLHPRLLGVLARLPRLVPGFAPLGFARASIDAARARPAEELVTLDALFDAVLPGLRRQDAFRPALAAYDALRCAVPSRFEPPLGDPAERLLKGIALLTLCPSESASVRALAEALLVFDSRPSSPSYSLASTILGRMEREAGLTAEGTGLDRRYRLALVPEEAGPAEEGGLEPRLFEWWATVAAAATPEALSSLPDSFRTVRFWNEVRSYEIFRALLEEFFARFRAGKIELEEALQQVARGFSHSPEQLAAWKRQHEKLSALLVWAPGFERAREYLASAFATGQESLDAARLDLLEAAARPLEFLESANREEFDRGFLQFRERYGEAYEHLHERTLKIAADSEAGTGVDQAALRNLELLSKLHHTDKSYVNRVRVIGRWLQTRQCALPVREVLARHPRCYCNFNPWATRGGDSVAQLNGTLRDGITYFRAILRQRDTLITQGLKALHAEDAESRQVAALLGAGPMVPLRPPTIALLNRIIQAHSDEFSSTFRSYKP
ncbi:MAG: hypothetical protein DMG07_24925, partial [Acidobacteria bacterium]